MERLIKINKPEDISLEYQNTPIGLLLEYHNCNRQFDKYTQANLLIGMCMDNRKHLKMPDNFAYIIRSGGANLRYSQFKVSYAIAVGDVQHIALIGHNNCGMVNLEAKKELFVSGMIKNAGWTENLAEKYFDENASNYEIGSTCGSEIDFILSEVTRLRKEFPKIKVAPLFYLVEDNLLYIIEE